MAGVGLAKAREEEVRGSAPKVYAATDDKPSAQGKHTGVDVNSRIPHSSRSFLRNFRGTIADTYLSMLGGNRSLSSLGVGTFEGHAVVRSRGLGLPGIGYWAGVS